MWGWWGWGRRISTAPAAQPRPRARASLAVALRAPYRCAQVRCMAAVLLMVGRGQERPGVVSRLLDIAATPRKPQYAMAPEVRTDSDVRTTGLAVHLYSCRRRWFLGRVRSNVRRAVRTSAHSCRTARLAAGAAAAVRVRLRGPALPPHRTGCGGAAVTGHGPAATARPMQQQPLCASRPCNANTAPSNARPEPLTTRRTRVRSLHYHCKPSSAFS